MIYTVMICNTCHSWQLLVVNGQVTVIHSSCPVCKGSMVPVGPGDKIGLISDLPTQSVPVPGDTRGLTTNH